MHSSIKTLDRPDIHGMLRSGTTETKGNITRIMVPSEWCHYREKIMKRPYLIFLIIMTCVPPSESSSSSVIPHIRELYKRALEMEQAPEVSDHSHEVTFNTVLPAVGLQTTRIRFLYTARQVDPRRDPYLLDFRLLKVTVTYNIAASINTTLEYLYDEKERPVFFSRQVKSAMPEADEMRLYFHDGTLFMAKIRKPGDDGRIISYSRSMRFSDLDKKAGVAALKKARGYHHHFKLLVELEKLK